MTGLELKQRRLALDLKQTDVARDLHVTQAYLSMWEAGKRFPSEDLDRRASELLACSQVDLNQYFKAALGTLGYLGFQYLSAPGSVHPSDLLLHILDSDHVDARVVEALPFLVSEHKHDFETMRADAKMRDRQNRLAFISELGRQAAETKRDHEGAARLAENVHRLERSRLAAEDTLCHESMTEAERRWLRNVRSPLATHWNLLTDLCVESPAYV